MFYDILKSILTIFSSECYFRTHWKIYCPGCGGTRALVALLHGEILQSIKYNPITCLFLLDVLLTTLLCIIQKKFERCSTAKLRLVINVFFLIFVVAYFLLRNFVLYALGIDVLGDISL